MPLHDWTDRLSWDGVHQSWNVELLRWIKPRLPHGYRAFLGTVPALVVGAPAQHPDVHVRSWLPTGPETTPIQAVPAAAEPASDEPDEQVAVITLDPQLAVQVTQDERLVAVVELISPRNKDRPDARDAYRNRYLGYLYYGVHLLLVDVHRRPQSWSFADSLAAALAINQPACPAPLAISYRVGDAAATGGRLLAIWRRPLAVDAPLPTVPLALTPDLAIQVSLEPTYMAAAADAYLT
jgi:hypothetical protein